MSMTHVLKRLKMSNTGKLAKSNSVRMSTISKQSSVSPKGSKVSSKKALKLRSKRITKETRKNFWHVRVPHEKKPSQFAKAQNDLKSASSDCESDEESQILAPKFPDTVIQPDQVPASAINTVKSDERLAKVRNFWRKKYTR